MGSLIGRGLMMETKLLETAEDRLAALSFDRLSHPKVSDHARRVAGYKKAHFRRGCRRNDWLFEHLINTPVRSLRVAPLACFCVQVFATWQHQQQQQIGKSTSRFNEEPPSQMSRSDGALH
jgi:hypothetical protein